jgi:hypothetical protein
MVGECIKGPVLEYVPCRDSLMTPEKKVRRPDPCNLSRRNCSSGLLHKAFGLQYDPRLVAHLGERERSLLDSNGLGL